MGRYFRFRRYIANVRKVPMKMSNFIAVLTDAQKETIMKYRDEFEGKDIGSAGYGEYHSALYIITRILKPEILYAKKSPGVRRTKIKISACLLTKSEADNIGRCLENIAPYVDEIVIIDGYSTDKTVEIARKYTDKNYQKEFSGSFAVERNYSIEKSTGDWVFIMDADEMCEKSLLEKLRELTNRNKYDAYSFLRKDVIPNREVLDLPCCI